MAARTIIVPLDGSDFAARALPVACAAARAVDRRLILMSTQWEDEADGRAAYLERVAQKQADIETEVLLVDEHPAGRAIASVARSHPGSTVCMTSHGRGGLRWAILGSVAEEVVRESREPVLLVGGSCATDWPLHLQQLLVCVDEHSAADAIVPAASAWAQALGLDIRVVTVVHPSASKGTTRSAVIDAITARFISDGAVAEAVTLRGSYVAGTIADYAHELPAGLIATGSGGRSGIARAALGSVAMGVVGLAPCPVLVIPSR